MGHLAGWGSLVHFDTAEHEITDEETLLLSIPKLATPWKIIHEFKPTDYSLTPDPIYNSLPPNTSLIITTSSGQYFFGVQFNDPNIGLHILDYSNTFDWFESDHLPELGEWTRIEISLEEGEEDGKHIISLSVGGKDSLRKEVKLGDRLLSELDGIEIYMGGTDMGHHQPGYIRGLVVLEKQ